MPEKSTDQKYHAILAAFFQQQPPSFLGAGQEQANLRKCMELPWQHTKAANWEALSTTLSDVEFIRVKISAGFVKDLLLDFSAIDQLDSSSEEWAKLSELRSILLEERRFLTSYPYVIYQHIHNQAKWSIRLADNLVFPSSFRMNACMEIINAPVIKEEDKTLTMITSEFVQHCIFNQDGSEIIACDRYYIYRYDTRFGLLIDRIEFDHVQIIRLLRDPRRLAIASRGKFSIINLSSHRIEYSIEIEPVQRAIILEFAEIVNDSTFRIICYGIEKTILTIDSKKNTLAASQEPGLNMDEVGQAHTRKTNARFGKNLSLSSKDNKITLVDTEEQSRQYSHLFDPSLIQVKCLSPPSNGFISADNESITLLDHAMNKTKAFDHQVYSILDIEQLPGLGFLIVGENSIQFWNQDFTDLLFEYDDVDLMGIRTRSLSGDKSKFICSTHDYVFHFNLKNPEVDIILYNDYGSKNWDYDYGTPKLVKAICWTDEDMRLIIGCGNYLLTADEYINERPKLLGKHKHYVKEIKKSPKGNLAASLSVRGELKIWDLDQLALLNFLNENDGPVNDFLWMKDETKILTCGADRRLKIWDCHSGRLEQVLSGHDERIDKLYKIPNSSLLFSTAGHVLKIWDLALGADIRTFISKGRIRSFDFNSDLSRIVLCDWEGNMYLVDPHIVEQQSMG